MYHFCEKLVRCSIFTCSVYVPVTMWLIVANSLVGKDGFPGSSVPELFSMRRQIVDF